MADLDHLSYSSISSYLMCARAWRYHYLDKAPALTSPALVFGSAFHEAAELYVRNPDGDTLPALWSEAWAAQLKSESERVDWGLESAEGLNATGHRMANAGPVRELLEWIRERFTDETDDQNVERRVELRVPGVPIPVIGFIDVITTDGIPGDFKTAARMWSDSKAEDSMQSLFYLAALNQAGVEVPGWKFRHYVFTKTAKPDAKMFEVSHKPAELFWLFEMIAEVWRCIEAGVFPPNPQSWKCSPKYCEFWSLCRGKYL